MKLLYFLIIIVFSALGASGQGEYYLTDSIMFSGIKLIDGGDKVNSRYCQVKMKDKVVRYSPYEVMEFGFRDGRIFVSREIQIADSLRRVFLRRLNKGNTHLYYYRDTGIRTYFIEKDSNLVIELPKHNIDNKCYTELLSELTNDCPNVADAAKLVGYGKKSLSTFINRYNTCKARPFPHFKYGLFIGYEFSRLIPSNELSEVYSSFNYHYDGGLAMGLFLDNPILVSDFSLHVEVYFTKHGFSYNRSSPAEDLDLIVNVSSFRIPVWIKYSVPVNRIRPYFYAGALYSYNIKNESNLYMASISDNMILINSLTEGSSISKNEIGYGVGFGLEYDLDYRKSIFIEIRHNDLYGITENMSHRNSIFHLTSGINF